MELEKKHSCALPGASAVFRIGWWHPMRLAKTCCRFYMSTAAASLYRSWQRQLRRICSRVQLKAQELEREYDSEFQRSATTATTKSASAPKEASVGARQRGLRMSSPLAVGAGTCESDLEATAPTAPDATRKAAAPSGAREHHVRDANGRLCGFRNPWTSEADPPPLKDIWRVRSVWNKETSRVTQEQRQALQAAARTPDWSLVGNVEPQQAAIAATWIGHASFILQFPGRSDTDEATQPTNCAGRRYDLPNGITTVYLDPIFSERASPVSFLGPKRLVRAAPLQECPLPDVVCISHNHYDHCDIGTIRALVASARAQRRTISWLVPLGVESLLRDKNPLWGGQVPASHQIYELDWYEQRRLGRLEVTFVPAQHATGRTLWDRNQTLWGGWVLRDIETDFRCYFAGDTAYRVIREDDPSYPYPTEKEREQLAVQHPQRAPCPVFREIGDKWGPFDFAMIPIGAYSPRWFMSRFHVDPVDSVAIHRDVRARSSVAMHHSTFVLTDEGLGDPERRLAQALTAAGLSSDDFLVWRHGETRLVYRKTTV
jgi:N-acyl-phosphatidylethanolamine-hydrolysing phospholipase D